MNLLYLDTSIIHTNIFQSRIMREKHIDRYIIDCYMKSKCPDLEWWQGFKYVSCLLCKISLANSQYLAMEGPKNSWPILNLSRSFYPIITFSVFPRKTEFMQSYRATAQNFIGCIFIRVSMLSFTNLVDLREDWFCCLCPWVRKNFFSKRR